MTKVWSPHKHDAEIARLMVTPPGETVEEQRIRCGRYSALVTKRSRDLGHDAFTMAVDREREPHWWRNLGFIQDGPQPRQNDKG